MNEIKQKVCFIAILLSIAMLFSLFIVFKLLVSSGYYTVVHLLLTSLITGILLSVFIYENKEYCVSKLIIENQIMNIHMAKIETNLHGKGQDVEVVISCFGILLDSKVIKYNLEGIQLKNVEISEEYIYLTYGTEKKTERIGILCGEIRIEELEQVVEKFRYETGIVPVITGISK